jgi:hypothetical protein
LPPKQAPPPRYDGTPRRFTFPSGTRLTRIHSAQFAVTEFNPTVARSDLQGGRFDASPNDEYPFLYAAEDDATAVSEALLRDLPIDERGARLLPRVALAGRRIGWLRPTADLALVNLRSGEDLGAIGQDTWLIAAPAADYPMTRRWAEAIRQWAPWAMGLTWRSHREPDGFAYVFFGDRCPEDCFEEARDSLPVPAGDQSLDVGSGRLYVEDLLARYRVALM